MTSREWHRVRFVSAQIQSDEAGIVHSRVELEMRGGQLILGTARCAAPRAPDLRCVALATVEAVRRGAEIPDNDIELLGVKSIQAFEATIVLVSLAVRVGGARRRLVGAYLENDDLVKGAAISVLNAMNRYLGMGGFSV